MLSALRDEALRRGIVAEAGFAPKTVKWALSFDPNGSYGSLIELGDTTARRNRGRDFHCCPDLQQPELVGGSEARCHFLAETAQVVALIFKNDEDRLRNEARTRAKRAFFTRTLRQASQCLPTLSAAANALEDAAVIERIGADCASRGVSPTDKITLAIDGMFPLDSDCWHAWWRELRADLRGGERNGNGGTLARCFVSGALAPPERTLPKTRGLSDIGGLAMGDSLVGFDKDAFTSYGFQQGENCTISAEAAAAYQSMLNALIASNRRALAGARVVHWYSRPVQDQDNPLSWMEQPSQDAQQITMAQRAEELLDSIRNGQKPELATAVYYALTLSGASGRVMVRDWMEGRFEDLAENVGQWFVDLQVVDLWGGGPARDRGIDSLTTSLLRPKGQSEKYADWVKPVQPQARALWHAALDKSLPLPYSALAKAVLLISRDIQAGRMDGATNTGAANSLWSRRIALVKAYHTRKYGRDAQLMPYLNEKDPRVAYQCGRLMAVLRRVQQCALGDVGANVVQRYYGAASATPALVLCRLIKLSQFHIGKISGKHGPGLAAFYDRRIADIWGEIRQDPPRALSLEEQGLFAMGYYQQIAFDNASRPEKSAGVSEKEIDQMQDQQEGESND